MHKSSWNRELLGGGGESVIVRFFYFSNMLTVPFYVMLLERAFIHKGSEQQVKNSCPYNQAHEQHIYLTQCFSCGNPEGSIPLVSQWKSMVFIHRYILHKVVSASCVHIVQVYFGMAPSSVIASTG